MIKRGKQVFRGDRRVALSPHRVFVFVLVLVSILWIPVVQASQGGQLFIYIQAISSYLQPPVAVVFIMGCFWKRTNEKVNLGSEEMAQHLRAVAVLPGNLGSSLSTHMAAHNCL